MQIALVWIAAYLVAGIFYVRRDLKLPTYRQPNYVDTAKGRWRVRLAWLPVTVQLMFIFGKFHPKYFRSEALPSYATFLTLGLLGTWVVSN